DVLHREGDVRTRRVLSRPLGDRRRPLATEQMKLAHLADIDPRARDAGNGRPRGVFLEAERLCIEVDRLVELLGLIVDAIAGMMDLDDLDGHGCLLNVTLLAAPSCPWATRRSGRRCRSAA